MIIPYLCNMINDHKVTTKLQSSKTQSGEWEIQ